MAEEKLLGVQRLDISQLNSDINKANAALKSLGENIKLDLTDDIKKQVDSLTAELKRAAEETKKITDSSGSGKETKASKEAKALASLTKAYKELYDIQAKVEKSASGSQTETFWKKEEAAANAAKEAAEKYARTLKGNDSIVNQAKQAESVVKALQRLNSAKAAAADKTQTKADATAQKQYNGQLREYYDIQKQILVLENTDPKTAEGKAEKQRQLNYLKNRQQTATQQIEAMESAGLSNDEEALRLAREHVKYADQLRLKNLETTKQATGFQGVMEKVADTMIRMAAMALWNTISNAQRGATEFAKEYYDALNEIRIVTGESEASAYQMGNRFIQMAQKLSVNSSEIASAAVEFYRQGLSDSEVDSRQEATVKYAKVASLEFTEAAKLMTAATNSMELEAQRVADVFVYLGDASASGADEIGIAMQKASASAQEAGVSFEWLGAYISAVSEKTRQAPEVIGTAFNSIMARLHNIKATGFNEEDATRVNDVAKALATLPEPLEQINKLTGEWVDMSTIFEELAKQWDDLDDRQRAYLATTIAGTRQQNVFLTLMNDMAKAGEGASRVYQLYAGALESSGSVTEKYSIYQESVAATMDGLNAKWQEFVNLFNGGGVFKTFYSAVGKLIDILTAGTKATDGWNLVQIGVGATLLVVIGLIPKIVAGIHAITRALNIANVATSKTKIGLIISSLIALGGVIATVVAGTKDLNSEREKIDYDSEINDIKNNISSLEALASEYETLAGKTNKSTEEYQRMDSIIEEIKGKAPGYAEALSRAQGDVTESIRITNEALGKQIELLRDMEIVSATQELNSADSLSNWKTSYAENDTTFYENILSTGLDKILGQQYYDTAEKSFAEFDRLFTGQGDAGYINEAFNLEHALDDVMHILGQSGTIWDNYESLYNAWNLGKVGALANVKQNQWNETSSEIAKLIIQSNQGVNGYADLSQSQKRAVHELMTDKVSSQVKEYGTGDLDGVIHKAQSDLNTVIQSVASSVAYDIDAITSHFKAKLKDKSIADNPATTQMINTVASNINSDMANTALDYMEQFYGDSFDQFVSENLTKHADPSSVFELWAKDPLSAMEASLRNLLNRNGGGEQFGVFNWAGSIIDSLKGVGYADTDIIKSLVTLGEGIRSGKVSFEELNTIFQPDADGNGNVAQNFGNLISYLNGFGESTKKAQSDWARFVEDASSGKLDASLSSIYEESQRVASIQGDLATAMSDSGEASTEAWSRLSEIYGGIADKGLLQKLAEQDIKNYLDGIDYLFEQHALGADGGIVDSLANYISESGIDLVKAYSEMLNSDLLSDPKIAGAGSFFDGGYAEKMFSSIAESEDGVITNLDAVASVFNAVTEAVDDGRQTWAQLVEEIDNGADAVRLYQLATEATADSEEEIVNKWQEKIDALQGSDGDRKAVIDDLREQALAHSRTVADLYLATAEGIGADVRAEATKRLYEQYGTTSHDLLAGLIDNEAANIADAMDYLAEYIDEGWYGALGVEGVQGDGASFNPVLALETQLRDLAALSSNVEAGSYLDSFLGAMTDLDGVENISMLAAAYQTLFTALEGGVITWEHLNTAAADGLVTFDEIMQMIDTAEFEALLENITSLGDAEQYNLMSSLFGEYGTAPNQDNIAQLQAMIKHYKDLGDAGTQSLKDIQDAMGMDDDLFEDFSDGVIDSADNMKKLQKQIAKLKLKNLEEAGEVMEGTTEAFEAAEKGGKEYNESVVQMMNDVKSLSDAMAAYDFIINATDQSTEEYASALSLLSSYAGISEDMLMNNMDLALNQITTDAQMATGTMSYLANMLYAVAGSSFDSTSWSKGLIVLSGDATVAQQNLAAMINTMLQAAGARVALSYNPDGSAQVVVRGLGSSGRVPTGGGGAGGGGGGGGKEKADVTADEQKMVDHMEWLLKLVEDAMARNDAIISRFETQGYLTGIINQLEQEAKLLEKRGRLYKENVEKLEKEIAAKQKALSGLTEGTEEYDEVLSELEILQDAYMDYTLALMENENALLENAEAIEEHRKAIRDMEIDLREELLEAIEDREDREEEMLDSLIEMQEAVLDAIIARYERERDEILRTNEMKMDAIQEEMDALDEAFEKRKEMAEEEDKQLELMKLEAQYNRIIADPTRAKEALEIQNKIRDLRDEIAWDIAEDEVDAQKESLEQQMTSLEDYQEYIEGYYEDLLENPRNFIEEVNSILSMSHEEILEWLKENSDEYKNSLDSSREQIESEWSETLDSMAGVTRDHWQEIEDIISQGDQAILDFLMEHRQDYREAGKLQAEAFVDEWKEQLQALKDAYMDVYEEVTEHPFVDTTETSTEDSSGGGGGGGGGGSTTQKKWYIVAPDGSKLTSGYDTANGAWVRRMNEIDYWNRSYQQAHGDPRIRAEYKSTYDKWNASTIEQFARGGLANFTGPMWIDGSKTNPERILSPYQTKLFESMVSALQTVATVKTPAFTNISTPSSGGQGGNSFGDIIVNVQGQEKDADYEELARKVGEAMLRQMNKGTAIGGIRYSF